LASLRRRPAHRPLPPSELRQLRKSGALAKKSLGQHFLTDQRTLRRISRAAVLSSRDVVIEIGAGLGDLTAELAALARRVIAVEVDDALAAHLARRFDGTNVTVVHGDALELTPDAILGRAGVNPPYVLTGNLPYNVAQPLLRRFLGSSPKPERAVVMVQAEVAESIAAKPGEMSVLSIAVQLYGKPELLFRVRPDAFYPPPRVTSAVVRIDIAPGLRVTVSDVDAFFHVVRAGFSTRRKQLRNALANGLRLQPPTASTLLSKAGIKQTLRAQDLALDQWAALTTAWLASGRPEDER
jgi:16S rRNA (adenine1518-N6/adenine1519-N6)-dimethyltransferase